MKKSKNSSVMLGKIRRVTRASDRPGTPELGNPVLSFQIG